jgi:hypothetical protein
MRIVHVHSSRAEFPKLLAAMREWLDRNSRPLVRFETESVDDSITVKLGFDDDRLAERFRRSFKGAKQD